MKIMGKVFPAATNRLSLFAAAFGLSLSIASSASAFSPTYGSSVLVFGGNLPVAGSQSITIKSPGNLPSGVATVVNVVVTPTLWALGSSATAASYISLDRPTVTFTGSLQFQTINVSGNFPLSAMDATVVAPGVYAYQVTTTGWGVPVIDNGFAINASLSSPPPGGAPPAVVIDSPVDGTTITSATFPINVLVAYHASGNPDITSMDATLNGNAVTLPNDTGPTVSNSVTLSIASPGSYTIAVNANNGKGRTTASNQFTVRTTGAAPVIAITPVGGSSFTLKAPATSLSIPINFTATSSGLLNIVTLSATLDGSSLSPISISGLSGLIASGHSDQTYGTATSAHQLIVTAIDSNNQKVTATSNYTVNYLFPTPAVSISQPTTGTSITLPTGATTTNVAYAINSSTTAGFTVDAVNLTLDGNAVTISSGQNAPALPAAGPVVTTGTLAGVGSGTHNLVATATSAGFTVTSTTISFTVVSSTTSQPPVVVINTPVPNATFTRLATGPALTIPLKFTGTSTATGGITKLTASLGSTPLTVTTTNLGQATAIGNASMVVSAAGSYTISVAAVDAAGTASATQKFTVTVVVPRNVCGTIFFDADYDGIFNHIQSCGGDAGDDRSRSGDDDNHRSDGGNYGDDQSHSENVGDNQSHSENDGDDGLGDRHRTSNYCDFGLSGVTVKLINSVNQVVATATSDCNGAYCFASVAPGSYTVSAVAKPGLKATTLSDLAITVTNADVTVPLIGFGLDFSTIKGLPASCKTISYWSDNLDKACSGRNSSMQVSYSAICDYTKTVSCFGLSAFDGISMKSACSLMKSSSPRTSDLLSKHLVTAEYNYSCGSYINGDRNLTFLFLWWGEYVLNNPSRYSSSYQLWATNWFDAYNNCAGGAINGPSS